MSTRSRHGLVAVIVTLFLLTFFHWSISGMPDQFPTTQRYAYATFLSSRLQNESDHDPYFTATRVLAYQLLHQRETRTQINTPLIVLVPLHVSETKRQRLREDGATVIAVDLLTPSTWSANPGEDRWVDQFTKLHLWNMIEFDRILYMDSDMLVTRCLDGIWEEEAVAVPQRTRQDIPSKDNLPLPAEYVLVAETDNEGADSERPTPVRAMPRLNAGFMVFKPDRDLFKYYLSFLEDVNVIFERAFMEMGLLIAAHRFDTPMPWSTFAPPLGRWSNNWPQVRDVRDGSATLHDKFWERANEDWIERELVEMWWRVQGRMEGFWDR